MELRCGCGKLLVKKVEGNARLLFHCPRCKWLNVFDVRPKGAVALARPVVV